MLHIILHPAPCTQCTLVLRHIRSFPVLIYAPVFSIADHRRQDPTSSVLSFEGRCYLSIQIQIHLATDECANNNTVGYLLVSDHRCTPCRPAGIVPSLGTLRLRQCGGAKIPQHHRIFGRRVVCTSLVLWG